MTSTDLPHARRTVGRPTVAHRLLVALTLALMPALAVAQDLDAEALVREGVELRRAGRDAEALEAFQRAYAVQPSARARAQVALAEQALGRWVEAEAGLAAALAEAIDPWIVRNEPSLRDALERVRDALGTLHIETEREGAAIWVNGEQVGSSPLPAGLRVPAGVVRVELFERGQRTASTELEVAPRAEINAKLTAPSPAGEAAAVHSAAAEAPAAAAPPPPPPAAEAPQARAATARVDSASAHGPPRWLGYGLAAVAGGLIATGVVAHVKRDDEAASYNDDATCFYGSLTRDQRCAHYRESSETAQTIAITAYALGAVALSGALVVLLWPDAPPDDRHVACIDVGMGANSGYLAATVRF